MKLLVVVVDWDRVRNVTTLLDQAGSRGTVYSLTSSVGERPARTSAPAPILGRTPWCLPSSPRSRPSV